MNMTEDNKQKLIDYIIGGTKIKVRDKVHAETQIKTLIKYHNLSTKQLMQKVKLPEKQVRRFKKWYAGEAPKKAYK